MFFILELKARIMEKINVYFVIQDITKYPMIIQLKVIAKIVSVIANIVHHLLRVIHVILDMSFIMIKVFVHKLTKIIVKIQYLIAKHAIKIGLFLIIKFLILIIYSI